MYVNLRGVTVVLLPGTGSDDDYVQRALGGPCREAGATVVAPKPRPESLIDGYRAALDSAATAGRIAVGGVSIGAAVAAAWALDNPLRTVAVLAALPAWTGEPGDAPAAASAHYTASRLRSDGLAAVTAEMRSSSPPWLADELARSWRGQWPHLPDAMDEAAAFIAPSREQFARLQAPMGVACALDDPIHPWQVGREWARAAPAAAAQDTTLAELGVDATVLGVACLTALGQAGVELGANARV